MVSLAQGSSDDSKSESGSTESEESSGDDEDDKQGRTGVTMSLANMEKVLTAPWPTGAQADGM